MKFYKRYREKLLENKFARNVFILVGGTVFAQGLVVLSSPILTRLYTPQVFGVLTTFISIISILNSVVSLKYELSLPLTRNKKETINLFSFNMFLISVISFLYLIIFLLYGKHIFSMIGVHSYTNLLVWMIPFTVLVLGITDNINYLFVKIERFKSITNIKVNSTIGKVVSQLIFGITQYNGFGLIAGDIVGRIIGVLIGLYLILRNNLNKTYRIIIRYISFEDMKKAAIHFKNFPMYSMPAGLINSISSNLTPILLIFTYGPTVAGFYSLTQRVLGLPSALVSQSISQVYLHEAPKLLEKDITLVRNLYKKTAKNLLLMGGIPILLVSIFGEHIFSFVFGDTWTDSGIYLQALALLFIGQFTTVPLSQTLNILNKQKIQFLWDFGRVIISIISIIIPSEILHLEPKDTIFIFSLSMFLMYVALYFLSLYYLQNKPSSEEDI
ncbi:lipopolysaccharide biosynthesis protein [Metabacillus halosaccharovorans]|uniref:lipopolysaccharide biosynthesis protein n=1 Tax=Metabacillus halosaccharovorans TaxID=930124 RepID=UPI0009951BE4|nr:oligosaccharide flippase family protein [Metabacillus halosaccharovorans]